LNTGKGPAVRALRAQADKVLYQREMKRVLEKQENLHIQQAMVEELIIEDGEVKGVITRTGGVFRGNAVILTTGTYLRGEIIIGDIKYSSGPNNMQPSIKLADQLKELGFDIVRFKTGTPPRLNGRTVDYSKMEIQPGDDVPRAFSYETTEYIMDQIPCWLTYTSPETHEIINSNLDKAEKCIQNVQKQAKEMIENVMLIERIIQYGNRYRSNPNVHELLLQAEEAFHNFRYIKALELAAEAVELAEPGAIKRIEELVQEEVFEKTKQ